MEDKGMLDSAGAGEIAQPETRRFYPTLKRGFDVFFALVGLMVLVPVGALIALIIKLSDRGPVFYRQQRVGLHGKLFEILKFRSMVVDADQMGPSVTQEQDLRITSVGRILRRTKLDELPQIWNVLTGEMSFVGPRPEVPRYVERYTPEQRQLLNYKPGITDLATLVFRNEETLLRGATDVEEFYVKHCIPRKFALNLRYAQRANLLEDFLIILETLCPYWLGVASGYALALAFCLWLTYQLRFDFRVPEEEMAHLERLWFFIVPLQMAFLIWRRQLAGLLSYFDVSEVKQLAYGLSLAAAVQGFVWYVTQGDLMPSPSIILMDAILAFAFLSGVRTLLRSLRENRALRLKRMEQQTGFLRVGIVGAGELGAWLARQLNTLGKGRRRVEAFFDDDPDKWNLRLCDVPVIGMPESILDGAWSDRLDEVILAIPGAPEERVQQIVAILNNANIRARTVPSLEEILSQ